MRVACCVLFALAVACRQDQSKSVSGRPSPDKGGETGANGRLPCDSSALDDVVVSLLSAFDHADVLALGESHQSPLESELRIRLVRNPEFAKKVRFIVVEFASTAQQSVLDRYVVDGEDVPREKLQQVWQNTTQTNGVWDSPIYADFFAAVRQVNKKLPADSRIRVLAGDPPTGAHLATREVSAVVITETEVLSKGAKALLIYGQGHLLRDAEYDGLNEIPRDLGPAHPGRVFAITRAGGITRELEATHPGRVFVVASLGGPYPVYEPFERALSSTARPVLLPLDKAPFGDAPADQTAGRELRFLVNGEVVSAYQGQRLGELADACVYWGMSPEVETRVR